MPIVEDFGVTFVEASRRRGIPRTLVEQWTSIGRRYRLIARLVDAWSTLTRSGRDFMGHDGARYACTPMEPRSRRPHRAGCTIGSAIGRPDRMIIRKFIRRTESTILRYPSTIIANVARGGIEKCLALGFHKK